MIPCDGTETHVSRRIVVTGGPGAGKTATLELIRRSSFCNHLQILPESAGIVWDAHPRRFIVDGTPDFLAKAARVLELLRAELPECCRHHVIQVLGEQSAEISQERRAS